MTTKSFYSTTFYMNSQFKEEYFDTFLTLIVNDKRFNLAEMKKRKKKGNIKGAELTSIAIRELVRSYVDIVTRKKLQAQAQVQQVQPEQVQVQTETQTQTENVTRISETSSTEEVQDTSPTSSISI